MGSLINLTKEKGSAILNGVLSRGHSLLWALRESNQDILNGIELGDKQTYISSWAPQLAVLAWTQSCKNGYCSWWNEWNS